MKEIAEHLGLRYATIIRAMKKLNDWISSCTTSPINTAPGEPQHWVD
jgi:hypothetical protein